MTDLILLSRVAFRGRQIRGARLIGLIALLAGDLRTGCGLARLVEGLWPDKQPEHPTNAVQVLVSRARALLGADSIMSTSTGYRLTLPDTAIDASAVLLDAHTGSRQSRAGDHVAALARAEAGLAHWQEAPSGQCADDPLSALRAERALTYHSLVRLRALSLSRLGRHSEARPLLTRLSAERPWDEELLLELLYSESAVIGPSAAVVRYDDYRRSLREELGTDPGPALQAVHEQLLRGESPTVRYGVLNDPNPLLGRDDDVSAVSALLRTSRVTSIVGTGGLGKTRLAHAVSRKAEQRMVYFVMLAGLTQGVAAEVASVLETEDVLTALNGSGALLVLDNCEHVIDEVADLVHAVVTQTDDVRVLTTSRAPLALSSEAVYQLPELDLSTAVELFTQRARVARKDVALPAPVVRELCRELDGLPLALELAAARVRVMSVEEISRRLTDRFSLLRGGMRDAPERHHTLAAVVEWSWQLLGPAGQAALPALSMFPGGFTAEAARFMLGSDEAIERLVDQSLLTVLETPAGTRFRMLETVREFGALRRDPAAVTDFLSWAKEFGLAHFQSPFGTDPVAAVDLIRAEQDNLLHAVRLAIEREDAPVVAAAAAPLAGLWAIEINYLRLAELANETAWLLSHYRPEPEFVDAVRAVAVFSTTNAFGMKGVRAVRSLHTLRRLPVDDPGDNAVQAITKVLAAIPEYWGADQKVLLALCEDPNPLVAGVANCVASYVLRILGDPALGLAAVSRAVERSPADRPWLRAAALSTAANSNFLFGSPKQAQVYMRMALPLFEQLDVWSYVSPCRWAMVLVSLQLDEIDEAEKWLALTALNRVDDMADELLPTAGVRAEIALARGEIDAGLREWRRAVDQFRAARPTASLSIVMGRERSSLEYEAVAVVAHAQHGRLDLVADIIADLPDKTIRLLATRSFVSSLYIMDMAVVGTALAALATVDRQYAPRLVALAERCHYIRSFQPTMAPHRIREWAERADSTAYTEAVADYATLRQDELRSVASVLLKGFTAAAG